MYFFHIHKAHKSATDMCGGGFQGAGGGELPSQPSQTRQRASTLGECARPHNSDREFSNKLDNTPYLLGVKNGVVDLRTGELRRTRTPEDMISKIANVEYDPVAPTQLMESTAASLMAGYGNPEYLQRVLGYCLTGETHEEVLFIMTGVQAATTLLSPLKVIMAPSLYASVAGLGAEGAYATQRGLGAEGMYVELDRRIIVDRPGSGYVNTDAEMAKLAGGVRVAAIAGKLRPGDKLKERMIKALAGGDDIVTADGVTIEPRFKCLLTTDFMPELAATTHIDQRLACIHFTPQVTTEDIVLLKAKLLADLPGAMNWMVQGAVKWYAHGLHRSVQPQVVAVV